MNDYDVVLSARGTDRLTAADFIKMTVTDFTELHGDRYMGDDKAVIAGVGMLGKIPVTVVGIEKGKTTEERITHNFGSASPEGYRKALRLMKQAEKFGRAVLCFVDTAGAFCGVEAEEHGQGRAIADSLFEMSDLKVPIVSVVIGEGGSGGALALSHADRIWMLDDAYFSVVSPESCANILWKDTGKAADAAGALCLTADKLYKLGIIDRVIGSKEVKKLPQLLEEELGKLMEMKPDNLTESRYRKFRKIGY